MRTGPTARPPARSLIRGPLQRLSVRLATRAVRHALSYEDPVSAATGVPSGPSGRIGGRKASLGQETTHWGRQFAYPNAPLPTPMPHCPPCCLPQCTVACPNAGTHPTPMRRCLPQCRVAHPVACPNAPLPAPMRARALPQCTVAYPDAGTSTAPMHRCLPQCRTANPVACPNVPLPTPDAGYGHPGLLCSRPPQVLRVPVADGASCPGGCETR